MRHLISASLLVCGGALVTWFGASLIEYQASERISPSHVSLAESGVSADTGGGPTAPVNPRRELLTVAALHQ